MRSCESFGNEGRSIAMQRELRQMSTITVFSNHADAAIALQHCRVQLSGGKHIREWSRLCSFSLLSQIGVVSSSSSFFGAL